MNNVQNQAPPLVRLIPDPNPWDDEAALPRLHPPAIILLALLVLACAVYLPSASYAYTLIMLAVCAIAYLTVVRSVASAAVAALVFLWGSVMGGMSGGVYALCLLVTVAIGAYLVCTVRSYRLLLIPVAAYLIALLIWRDPMLAVLAVLAMPAAGILAYATMKNDGRVGAICLCSLILIVCGVFGLSLMWYRSFGSISTAEVLTTLSEVREQLILTLQQSEYVTLLEQQLEQQQLSSYISPDTLIRTSIELVFNLLPALAVLTVNLISFAAQMTCTNAFVGTRLGVMATRSARLFILSVPSAIVFLISGAVSLFSSGTTLASAVMLNLMLILLPAMCIVGVYKLIADFKTRVSPLTVILMVAAVLFAPSLLLFGIAVSGAVTTLIRPLVTKMVLEKAREQLHDRHNDDSQDGDDRHDQ